MSGPYKPNVEPLLVTCARAAHVDRARVLVDHLTDKALAEGRALDDVFREHAAGPPPEQVAAVEDYDFGPPSDETCTTCQRGEWHGKKALAARVELGCPNPECADSKGRKHAVPGFVKMMSDAETPEVYLWTTPAEAAVMQSLPPDGEKYLALLVRVDALLMEHWETTGVQYQELQDAWIAAGHPDPDSGHPFWATLQGAK